MRILLAVQMNEKSGLHVRLALGHSFHDTLDLGHVTTYAIYMTLKLSNHGM